MRVIVLGIDGLAPQILDEGIESGVLKGFARLLSKGISFDLNSTFPPTSSVAWSTIITGLNPGKHGIYDFYLYRGGNKIEVADARYLPFTIFDIASDYNKKIIAINVPMTYPPWPINGLMLAGYPGPAGKVSTYPSSFAQEIEFPVLDYPYIELKAMEKAIRARGKYLIELMQRSPWDLFMPVFHETDTAHHIYWGSVQEIINIYRAIDESFVIPLLEYVEAEKEQIAIIVLGDHGAAPGRGVFHYSDWLYSKGLINIPSGFIPHLKLAIGRMYKFLEPTIIVRILYHILFNPAIRRRVLDTALIVGPDIIKNSAVIGVGSNLDQACNVYVTPSYQDRVDELLVFMQRELAKGDLPINITAHKREEFYTGPATKYAPHIILKMEEGYVANSYLSGVKKNFVSHKMSGKRKAVHSSKTMLSLSLFPEGLSSTDLRNKGTEYEMKMEDVGAVILWLLDIRAPKVLDGAVPDILYDLVQKSPDILQGSRNDLSYSIKVLKKAGVV